MRRRVGDVLDVVEPEAGMHVIAWLRRGFSERMLVRAAAAADVDVRPLSIDCREARRPPGIVLGYAAFPEVALRTAVARLARALATGSPR